MPNQADYDKVNSCLIQPLAALYNAKIPDELADGLVEDVCKYPKDTLEEAYKAVRRACKRMPSIAHIIEACEKITPKESQIKTNPEEVAFCKGHAEKTRPAVAREILSSPVGKLALQLGVGRDLLNEYENTGKKDFNEAYVRNCKRYLDTGAERLGKLDQQDISTKALAGLFTAMQNREKNLYQVYA